MHWWTDSPTILLSAELCLLVSRSEMFSVVVEAPYKANVSDNLGSDVVLGVSLVSAWCLSV